MIINTKSISHIVTKLLALITLLQFYGLQSVAAPEDHGKWYSLDDSSPSSHSPAFYIFSFIIGAIAGIIMIVITIKDSKQNSSDKGCIIVFVLGLLVIGFFCLLYLCR